MAENLAHAASNSVVEDEQLKAFVERIERLEAEKRDIAGDIKEVYAEAKRSRFDPKIMRKVIAIRLRDAAELAEEEALIEVYKHALGMLADTPLGEAAVVELGKSGRGRSAGA